MNVLVSCALAALISAASLAAEDSVCNVDTPCYSSATIVNSASYAWGWLGANTFGTVFGQNLAHVTAQAPPGSQDATGAVDEVRLLVNNYPAYISYVSPTQINFVVPTLIDFGDSITVRLARGGVAGPLVTVPLHDCAPALFQFDAATAGAAHLDWSPVTPRSPARPGEFVVLYATGLGPYHRPVPDMTRPDMINQIERLSEFKLYLDGRAVDSSQIRYVGTAPVSVGLMQINLVLPAWAGRNPEIRIALGDRMSPPGLVLPLE